VPRDLVGYGQDVPHADWPGGARIAVQCVINYEEGAERSILHGDTSSEWFLSDVTNALPIEAMRNMSVESTYEYGSRAGFWRLHAMFSSRVVPVTVFGVAEALAANPDAVAAMLASDWEIASHGLRWIDYQHVSAEVESEHIAKAIQVHAQVTGSRPLGWYTGRTSPNTRSLVVQAGGFVYESDSYADDLPYWCLDFGAPLLIIPYTLDANDMRFNTVQGFNSGDQFFSYLKDTFDTLYEEGRSRPRLMNLGLHCRIAGRPGRAAAVARFLDYARQFEDVWFCRRIDIAEHWHARHPAT
jgi:putative urate catabolism protein